MHHSRPLLANLTYIGYIEKYVLLRALFKAFKVDTHVYNSFPQGRVAWRHDSGLVTAVCRRQGVHSLGYQTRAYFGWRTEYCFDCFDTFCVWGEWWRLHYQEVLFVKDIEVIGSVFTDAYSKLSKKKTQSDHVKTVLLFPSDIHFEEPSYLTLDYTVQFFSAAIRAVSKLK